jgi:alkylhydroperoxidase/carboxymuconolactone decarboxylase family protein YurZ
LPSRCPPRRNVHTAWEAHAKAAHAAGASREEVVEASLIAAALRAGAAATHGTMALKFFDKQGEPKKE